MYAPRIYCILRLSSVWQATRESRKLLHDNKNAIVWSWLIEEGCGLKGGGVGRCGSTLTCSWWFCHCDNDAIVWLPPDCPSQWLICHRRSCHLWVDLRGSVKKGLIPLAHIVLLAKNSTYRTAWFWLSPDCVWVHSWSGHRSPRWLRRWLYPLNRQIRHSLTWLSFHDLLQHMIYIIIKILKIYYIYLRTCAHKDNIIGLAARSFNLRIYGDLSEAVSVKDDTRLIGRNVYIKCRAYFFCFLITFPIWFHFYLILLFYQRLWWSASKWWNECQSMFSLFSDIVFRQFSWQWTYVCHFG